MKELSDFARRVSSSHAIGAVTFVGAMAFTVAFARGAGSAEARLMIALAAIAGIGELLLHGSNAKTRVYQSSRRSVPTANAMIPDDQPSYGPNQQEVSTLLKRLSELGPDDCGHIEFVGLDGGRSHLANLAMQHRRSAYQRKIEAHPAALGRRDALEAALERFHRNIDSVPSEQSQPSAMAQMIVVVALTAVVHRDFLLPKEFDTLYEPLQSLISSSSLSR